MTAEGVDGGAGGSGGPGGQALAQADRRARNDLLFRLHSLHRRFPLVVSDELFRSWTGMQTIDIRHVQRDVDRFYTSYQSKSSSFHRGHGSEGSSFSSFGGGSSAGGGGGGGSW